MAFGIWLIVLGILGAANLIIARKPDAAQLIAKIAPYQGWIGALSALSGVAGLVMTNVLGLSWLGTWPIYWITSLACNLILLALGLLLGVGVLKTFIKDPTANAKMDQTIAKLAPKQGVLGLVGIGLGIWTVVCSFLFYG
jgi:hypothetical protein